MENWLYMLEKSLIMLVIMSFQVAHKILRRQALSSVVIFEAIVMDTTWIHQEVDRQWLCYLLPHSANHAIVFVVS